MLKGDRAVISQNNKTAESYETINKKNSNCSQRVSTVNVGLCFANKAGTS